MSSIKVIMHEPNNGREIFPHNFADQTWVGRDSFITTPHNVVNTDNFYTWSSDTDDVFMDADQFTGYIEDGSLYTTDTMTSRRSIGILTSVDAGDPYIVKFTNKYPNLQGIVHWIQKNDRNELVEIAHDTFTPSGREFIAPAGATVAAIGWKGTCPINTRIVANFGVLTKGGQSVQDWIEGVIGGSIPVGDSNKLGGKDPDYYYYRHEAEQLIQDLTDGTFTVNNSYHLDGKDITYFATKEEFDLFVTNVLEGPLTVHNSNNLGGVPAEDYLLDKNAVKVYSGQSAPGTIAGAKLNDLYIQLKQ